MLFTLFLGIIAVLYLAVILRKADASYSCEYEEPIDVCSNLEGDQDEVPDGYLNDGDYCYIPEVPKEEPTPGLPGNSPTFAGSSTNAPGVCPISNIGDVANIYVKQTGNKEELEVQWSLPENADQVHIEYGLQQSAEHALLNTPNDGNEVIRNLKSGEHYWFRVAGVRECGVGNYSNWFDPIVP